MSLFDSFRYDGKRAVVVGGATGMGAGVAQLVQDAGADVVVLDFAEVTQAGVTSIHVNLGEQKSIDAAVEQIDGPVDALFSCAGVADGTPNIDKINFIGHRHLIGRLQEKSALGKASAIGFISSAAGLGWEANLGVLHEYLDTPDFDSAVEWVEAHHDADFYMSGYMFSKQAICAYVARSAMGFLKQGIRINAICPGPTDTPLARANADMWLGFGQDYRDEVGIEASTPLEQAYALVFLCSGAASVITGQTLITDAGYFPSGVTGSFPAATPVAQFLLGRM
ncbi:MAG TPA: SDR family oxidoreductase [Acidimicrobiia bacterium]|jgi:NAD(P)-dependent dehydrogenase (short-subunit alcohol dehydrogenase family)